MIPEIKNIGWLECSLPNHQQDDVSIIQTDRPIEDDSKKDNLILDIDVRDEPDLSGKHVFVISRQHTNDVYREGLHRYNLGGKLVGGLLPQEKYEKEISQSKYESMIQCLNFSDISLDYLDEVKIALASEIQRIGKTKYTILFLKNGQKPIDSQADKFLSLYKSSDLKLSNEPGYCHICGKHVDHRYNSCGYTFYTNDKKIFNQTDGLSFGACDDCITYILYGKRFAENYLTTWHRTSGSGKSKVNHHVLFLPATFDARIRGIFLKNDLSGGASVGLLRQIAKSEAAVFRHLGECGTRFTLIFYYNTTGRTDFKIEFIISNVMSSMFTRVADLQQKYRSRYTDDKTKDVIEKSLSLQLVLYYLLGGNAKDEKQIDLRDVLVTNEARRFLDAILHGTKIDKNLFATRALQVYKRDYMNGKPSMRTFHRIFNFLCDCGCLTGGWNMPLWKEGETTMMPEYNSVDAFFEDNKCFDTDVKKGWFLLGKLYSVMVWTSKKYYNRHKVGANAPGDEPEELKTTKSYLEKAFFFGRNFDKDAFAVILNKCSELAHKYDASNMRTYKETSSEAKHRMFKDDDPELTTDWAKIYFFWGMTQWIEKVDDSEEVADDACETVGVEI